MSKKPKQQLNEKLIPTVELTAGKIVPTPAKLRSKSKIFDEVFESLKKPSDVIRLIIDGLEKKSRDKKFKFDMMDYGTYQKDNHVCIGCLATSTLHTALKISNEDAEQLASQIHSSVRSDNISKYYLLPNSALYLLETSIDKTRIGEFNHLISQLNATVDDKEEYRSKIKDVHFEFSISNPLDNAYINRNGIAKVIQHYKDFCQELLNLDM